MKIKILRTIEPTLLSAIWMMEKGGRCAQSRRSCASMWVDYLRTAVGIVIEIAGLLGGGI